MAERGRVMQDLNDDNLDALLREHFARELDPQLGKVSRLPVRVSRRLPWRAASLAGLAMAAAIAGILLFRPAATAPRPPAQPTQTVAANDSVPGEYQMAWQTIDQGTVFLDEDTPMRSYLKQRVERVSWVDPDTQETVEYTVPHDEIVLVALNTI